MQKKRINIISQPEVVHDAHWLFVRQRFGFSQIARWLKHKFGISTKVKHLRRQVSRWAVRTPQR